MDGPVNRIAIDKTGTKIAIAYGKEVVVLEQNTLCKSVTNLSGVVPCLTIRNSLLDQCSEVA